MFRSLPMYRVELVVPEHDIVVVTEALAAAGVFHMSEYLGAVGDGGALQTADWDKRANTYISLVQRIADVMELLDVEPGPPPKETLHLINSEVAEKDVELAEAEAKGPAEELAEARGKLDRLREMRGQLGLLSGLDIDLQLFRSTRYLFTMLGAMPVDNVQRLESSLEHIPSVLLVLTQTGSMAVVALFGRTYDSPILQRAARSAYLTPTELPEEYQGTPDEILAALDETIAQTRDQVEDLQGHLVELHNTRVTRLRHLMWRVRASLKLVQTISKFSQFRYMYLVTGWVPEPKLPHLRETIAEVSDNTLVEARSPTARERLSAPFEFQNPPILRIFEQLVTIYGYPAYDELDPTPIVALTFPLIFGVMFGDVGHGLLLALLGFLILSRRVRALQSFAPFGGVVAVSGIMSMVFGFLYGNFFGFEQLLPSLWLRPLESTSAILIATISLGMAVITMGMIYNVIGTALKGAWLQALINRNGVAGILFYWSLIGLAASYLTPNVPVGKAVLSVTALLSGLVLAFSSLLEAMLERGGSPGGNVGMTIVEGFFELFENVLSVVSNTLSYVRMGAFAVAHGALSMVVFLLANMVDAGHSVAYWLVVAFGNLLVIGFEGMIVAIQTLRLEYYELFSKFFTASGERYQPLTLLASEEE